MKDTDLKKTQSSGKAELVNDFTEGNVTGRLIKFATPLFLGNMLQVVYNMVDMMIVGNVIGKAGLSGGDHGIRRRAYMGRQQPRESADAIRE